MSMENRADAPIAQLYQRGREQFTELVDGGGERLDALFHTAPALGELAVGVVYGHLHARPGLDSRLREAASLAAIVAAGVPGAPLSVHLKTGLASGLAPGEVVELVLQSAAFSGFPRAVSAADQLNRLFEESGWASPPPPCPREVALRFCEAVRSGDPQPLASPSVTTLLGEPREIEVYATASDRVVVECFAAGRRAPEGVLHVRVDGERVVDVVAYHTEEPPAG